MFLSYEFEIKNLLIKIKFLFIVSIKFSLFDIYFIFMFMRLIFKGKVNFIL